MPDGADRLSRKYSICSSPTRGDAEKLAAALSLRQAPAHPASSDKRLRRGDRPGSRSSAGADSSVCARSWPCGPPRPASSDRRLARDEHRLRRRQAGAAAPRPGRRGARCSRTSSTSTSRTSRPRPMPSSQRSASRHPNRLRQPGPHVCPADEIWLEGLPSAYQAPVRRTPKLKTLLEPGPAAIRARTPQQDQRSGAACHRRRGQVGAAAPLPR